MSKDFLHLYFAEDQVLSIFENNLENGRMQKYLIKNMVVKIPILISFHFCLLCWLSHVFIAAASGFNYLGPFRWF